MSILNRNDPDALTPEGVEFLRTSSSVPAEIKAFVARQHETIGTATPTYRTIAAAARAKAEAILAVRLLDEVQGEASNIADLRAQLSAQRNENERLNAEIRRKNRETLEATARPALAVHSGND